jgi:hypothetical protein
MIYKRLILEKQPTGKVSEFFSYEEFTQSNYGKPVFNKINQYLLENLCRNILDPIRKELGHTIVVTSGIRDVNVMEGLRKAGFYPSANTDHSFGDPEVNPFGVGAADIAPKEDSCEKLFTLFCELFRKNRIRFGQCLWERQGSREWVHIANPKTALFQQEVARMIASGLVIGYGLEGKYFSETPWN